MRAIPLLGYSPEGFRRDLAFILGFNVLFLIFLNNRPIGQAGLITQTLLIVGPFSALLGTGLRGLTWPPWREDRSILFIAAAVILFAAGQFVTIDRIILG
ncbi:MAG TPA: hypothetical protein VKT80_01890, partial [Chloroflexota bacterium]|nr:hypothetical protein [Chloroflexota bacterium]